MVDMSYLAKMMLQWEQLRLQLNELEDAICDTVMQIGKTQTVGNVRATYSVGRKTYDYQAAVKKAELPNDIWNALYTDYKRVSIDWRGLCRDERSGIGQVDIPFTQSMPSVRVKLV